MKIVSAFLVLVTTVMTNVSAATGSATSSATPDHPAWWKGLVSQVPIPAALRAVSEALGQPVVKATAAAAQELRDAAEAAIQGLERLGGDDGNDESGEQPQPPPPPPPPRRLTLYQTLKELKEASKFAKLVDKMPSLVEKLNSTDADGEPAHQQHQQHQQYTLLVPRDDAFDKIPDKYKKPDRDTLDFFLRYHVVSGTKRARHLFSAYTLQSEAVERLLGNEKQRIRVGLGLTGINFNEYSTITSADIEATNGVIHLLSDVLVPPPFIGVIMNLFPAQFSTILLAYQRTQLVRFIHAQHLHGSTVVLPSNRAFARLGPAANAFLFNTDPGTRYLEAILKYGIVPNATVYSDAFYDKRTTTTTTTPSSSSSSASPSQDHYSLDTFLPAAPLTIDIASVFGFRIIKINGFTTVSYRDVIGGNGVIHVVDKVVFPPRPGHHQDVETEAMGEMTVEEIKARLDPYLAQDTQEEPISGDL